MTAQSEMEAAFEALLFVATEPIRRQDFLAMFSDREVSTSNVALDAVLERYRETEGRGIMLDEVGGGLRLVTRPELHSYLATYFETSSRHRISMAALESLAIIAYRQPVTAPEIQELRGVSSTSVLRTLLENRLVRIAGRKDVVGRPYLYRTTREFLVRFGLNELGDLPPLEEFEELLEAGGPAADPEQGVLAEMARLDERGSEHSSENETNRGDAN